MRRALLILTVAALVATGCKDDTTPVAASGDTTTTVKPVNDADVQKVVAALTEKKNGEPAFMTEDQAKCVANTALPQLSDAGTSYLTDGIKTDGDSETGSTSGSGTKTGSTTTTEKGSSKPGVTKHFKDLKDAESAAIVSAFNTCLPLEPVVKAVITGGLSSVDLGQKELDCATDKLKPDFDGSGNLLKALLEEDSTVVQKVIRVGFKCFDDSNKQAALNTLFAAVSDDPSVGSCLAQTAMSDGQAEDLFTSLIAGEKTSFQTFLTKNGDACGFDTTGGGGASTSPTDPAAASSGVGSGI